MKYTFNVTGIYSFSIFEQERVLADLYPNRERLIEIIVKGKFTKKDYKIEKP